MLLPRNPCSPKGGEAGRLSELQEQRVGYVVRWYEHGIFRLHGFAPDYCVSDADFLIRIPFELEDVAVLLESLSVGEKAISQIFEIQYRMSWEPKRALITGVGPLSLLQTR